MQLKKKKMVEDICVSINTLITLEDLQINVIVPENTHQFPKIFRNMHGHLLNY